MVDRQIPPLEIGFNIEVLNAMAIYIRAMLSATHLDEGSRKEMQGLLAQIQKITTAHGGGSPALAGPPAVAVPDSAWELSGTALDLAGRRTARILVNGVSFTLEAYRVRLRPNGVHEADTFCADVAGWFSARRAALLDHQPPGGVIDILGEQYVVFGAM